ncbi:MAG: hypothetical protein EXQ90_03515 [Rhodospirillales bacterium]|nr:hypothetical protein [Rhodospirillales bacterium]
MAEFDLVIRGGTVVTAADTAACDIGVKDGVVHALAKSLGRGRREIVAQAQTEADELIIANCDLDNCTFGKETAFNFAQHRRIEHYSIITTQTGVVPTT